MGNSLLIGTSTQYSTGLAGNKVRYMRYQAQYTGIVKEIAVIDNNTGYCKVALYADDNGNPGARLSYDNTERYISQANTWFYFPIPDYQISAGTYYWLAYGSEATLGGLGQTGSNLMKDITFSSYNWPDPADSGLTTHGYNLSIGGWGVLTLAPSGIAQPVVYGSHTVKPYYFIVPSGIEQIIGYGEPTLAPTQEIAPTGIEQTTQLGQPAILTAQPINPPSIEQPTALGTPELVKLLQEIQPTGIQQSTALGTHQLEKLLQTIEPQGIQQAVSFGQPEIIQQQFVSPAGIQQTIAYGTHQVGVVGIISPTGISQKVEFGTHQLTKYVWHIILDGQYAVDTPTLNRVFIIGRDDNGNPVYGLASDSDEIALVGERLDFRQDLSVPSSTLAQGVASAVLSKMRLNGNRGIILIPPNCGQELWDVVQITDKGANQQAAKYRVIGIRLEYDQRQARYQQQLILGAP